MTISYFSTLTLMLMLTLTLTLGAAAAAQGKVLWAGVLVFTP
jgi:hypothetical protein